MGRVGGDMVRALLAALSYDPVQRWGPVSPHGVGTAAGFAIGAWITARNADLRGIPRQETYNAVSWGALGAILGARGFYVLAHADQFDSVRDVLAVWEGGLTMFGGFVGGLAFGLVYLYRRSYDLPLALDAAAPGFVAGVIVGRMGDIVIADHLGTSTDFFLGYRIPEGVDLAPGYGPPTYVAGAVVHHTALYDLLGALVLAGVLALVARRRPVTGSLFATFALWYGLQRFVVDFTRNREVIESFFFGLSGSQWAGLGFAAGAILWFVRFRPRTRAREATAPAEPAEAAPPAPSGAAAPAPPMDARPVEQAAPTSITVAPSEERPTPPPDPRPFWPAPPEAEPGTLEAGVEDPSQEPPASDA